MKLLYAGDGPMFVKGPRFWCQLLLLWVWSKGCVIDFVLSFFRKFIPNGYLIDYIVPVFFVLCCIVSLRYILRMNSSYTLGLFFFFAIFVLLSWGFGNEVNQRGIELYFPQMITAIPCVLLGCCLDYKRDIKLITVLSWLNVASIILYQFYFMGTGREVSDDMMGEAYRILPNVIICFLTAFQCKFILSYVFAILGFLFLLVAGTRGAVVSLLVFLALYFVLFSLKTVKNKWKLILGIIVIGAVFIANLDTIFSFTETLGFGTRIYDQLMGVEEMTGSGREDMHMISLQEILNNPFTIRGVGGERYLYQGVAVVQQETYPHNFILEILLQFGVIIGILLLIVICILPIKAYRKRAREGNKYEAMFIVALCSAVFCNLFFSFTLWTTPLFFFLLSYLVKESRF